MAHVPAQHSTSTPGTVAEPPPVTPATTAAEPLPAPVDTTTPEPVAATDAPATVQSAELISQNPLSAALAPLFGSGTGDLPVASPTMWLLAAAARNEFRSGGSSLTDGNLLRTSPDTGEDVGASAAVALNSGGQTGLVVDGSLITGGSPSGVAVSGDRVFVTNQSAGTMTVYKQVGSFGVGDGECGGSPTAVVVNSAGTRAYVANSSAGQVTVIDTTNYSSVASIKAGSAPSALALTPDGTRLLVANAGSNTVVKIDTATNRGTTLPTNVGKSPSSIAVSADGPRAYVRNAADGSVTVINLSANDENH